MSNGVKESLILDTQQQNKGCIYLPNDWVLHLFLQNQRETPPDVPSGSGKQGGYDRERIKEEMEKIKKQLLEVLKKINRIEEQLQRERLRNGFEASDLELMPITDNMHHDLEKMVARLVYCGKIEKWRLFIDNAKEVADSFPFEQEFNTIIERIETLLAPAARANPHLRRDTGTEKEA